MVSKACDALIMFMLLIILVMSLSMIGIVIVDSVCRAHGC